MASNSPSSCSETLSNSCPSVFVSNDLMQLIKEPEEEKREKETSPPSSSLNVHLTTMDDLLMHVKNYIVKHKLYDPANPLKILVHDTQLGSLLGKSEFSLLDVRDILLEKFVYPVEAKNSSEVICSIREKMCVPKKRKFDKSLDSEFSVKRIKGVDDNSDESMHSIQDYETEYVKDSTPSLSDDNFSVDGLIFAETFDVDVEYQIEPHTDNSDFSCESDSDIEDLVKNAIITFIASSGDSDLEYLADGSSDETMDSELEISEKDKWVCSSCLTSNDPRMRCCEACWLTRVGWLSDERQKSDTRERKQKALAKKRSKRKLLKNKNKKNKDSSNYKLSNLPNGTTESLNSPSSCNDNTDVSSNTLEADKERTKKNELDKQLCLFCCARPADSSILHGKVACKICCFRCGKRLFDSNQRCPACRRVIERVVYLFNA